MGQVETIGSQPIGYQLDGDVKVFHLIAQPVEQALVDLAMDNNPEIKALEWELCQADAEVRLAKSRIIKEVGLGVAQEKSPGEPNGWGPAFAMQIPLFDQNQAQIAKAKFYRRQVAKELAAKKLEVTTQVRQTIGRYQMSTRQLSIHEAEIMPALQNGISYTVTYATRYQISVLMALEMFKTFTKAQMDILDLILDLNLALADIEQLTGTNKIYLDKRESD